MPSNRIKSVFVCFVFSSGLISCNSEKEATVNYQRDPFRVDRVSFVKEDHSTLRPDFLESVELGGSFRLDDLANTDFTEDPMILDVETFCRQPAGFENATKKIRLENTAQIPVLQTLPLEVLTTISDETVTCDFFISVVNTMGSKNSIPLRNKIISNLESYSNLALEEVVDGRVVYRSVQENKIPLEERGAVRMACEEAMVHLDRDSSEIAWKDFALDDPSLQSRLSHNDQRCRMVLQRTDGAIFVSQIITLVFPVTPPIIVADIPSFAHQSVFTDEIVVRFRVSNPNTYPIQVRMTDLEGSTFNYLPVYVYSSIGIIGTVRRAPIQWRSGAIDISEGSGALDIKIGPGETLRIDGAAMTDVTFAGHGGIRTMEPSQGTIGAFSAEFPYVFVGLNFDFSIQSQFAVLESEESDPSSINFAYSSSKKETSSSLGFWQIEIPQVLTTTYGISAENIASKINWSHSRDGTLVRR